MEEAEKYNEPSRVVATLLHLLPIRGVTVGRSEPAEDMARKKGAREGGEAAGCPFTADEGGHSHPESVSDWLVCVAGNSTLTERAVR